MTDFLLELLSEEIPARMQDRARDDLARLFADEIGKAGLTATAIETYATPRRLALIARDLPLATEPVSEEVKGPRADAPPQALAGFLGKTGLARDQLVERTDAKGNAVLFAVIERPGRATAQVLAEAIPAIVRNFPWPKSMRWGDGNLRWVRPLSGIVALLGEQVVPVEVDGIRADAVTVGHRFHHPGQITIGSAADYAAKLNACRVIVDQDERRRIIREGAAALAADAGLSVIPDEGLVAENAGLTEWPVPLLGQFDAAFLDLPREVIQLTMRTNQKYFALADGAGALAPNFICTANIDAADGGAGVVAGNAKVLSARLSDAKFFWEQDLGIKLEKQAEKLSGIVFHEKLGTVADKVDRVAKLARWLVEEGIVPSAPSPLEGEGRGEGTGGAAARYPTDVPQGDADAPQPLTQPSPTRGEGLSRAELADFAETAAKLAKADLVTGMVGEFPELQGIMGGYIAAAQGEHPAVAAAIRDHYKPVGQGDDVPTDPVTVAVSLADKLDTVFAFFLISEKPSGSRDPFALRRSTIASISIAAHGDLSFNLRDALTKWGLVFVNIIANRAVAETIAMSQDIQRIRALRNQAEAITDHDLALLILAQGESAFKSTFLAQVIPPLLNFFNDKSNLKTEVVEFFADRLKVQQREAGVRHDLIDAVFALGGEDNLVRLLARVKALQAFVATEDGANLLAGYKRAANILRIEEKKDAVAPTVTPAEAGVQASTAGLDSGLRQNDEEILTIANQVGYTSLLEEAALAAALDVAEPAAATAVEAERFEEAMRALAALRAPIDAFFDKVTVNDPDPSKRAARLALLARIRDAVHRVADFSKIEA